MNQDNMTTVTEEDRLRVIQDEMMRFIGEIGTQNQMSTLHVTSAQATMVECRDSKPSDYVKTNDIIDNRFKVIGKLREGGFGQIYKALDNETNGEVALKLEKTKPGKKNFEAAVLLKFSVSHQCPKMFAKGNVTQKVSYIAMQLLGKNLSELRKTCQLEPPRLSISSSSRLIVQCLRAVETLHNIGYIHRDVKPSNYAIGFEYENRNVVYLLDFGLSCYYLTKQGDVRPPRSSVGFRGTPRYASINAHDKKDLSRRDDIYSLFYSYFEMTVGLLPWTSNDKKLVGDVKRQCPLQALCNHLPKPCTVLVRLIEQLKFGDKPKYDEMVKCWTNVYESYKGKVDDPYDWELNGGCTQEIHWFTK